MESNGRAVFEKNHCDRAPRGGFSSCAGCRSRSAGTGQADFPMRSVRLGWETAGSSDCPGDRGFEGVGCRAGGRQSGADLRVLDRQDERASCFGLFLHSLFKRPEEAFPCPGTLSWPLQQPHRPGRGPAHRVCSSECSEKNGVFRPMMPREKGGVSFPCLNRRLWTFPSESLDDLPFLLLHEKKFQPVSKVGF